MSDYPHLRQRTSDLQQQLLAAERKLSEHRRRSSELQQMVKQLQSHQAQPSPELCALQSELEQMRKTHHKVETDLSSRVEGQDGFSLGGQHHSQVHPSLCAASNEVTPGDVTRGKGRSDVT